MLFRSLSCGLYELSSIGFHERGSLRVIQIHRMGRECRDLPDVGGCQGSRSSWYRVAGRLSNGVASDEPPSEYDIATPMETATSRRATAVSAHGVKRARVSADRNGCRAGLELHGANAEPYRMNGARPFRGTDVAQS